MTVVYVLQEVIIVKSRALQHNLVRTTQGNLIVVEINCVQAVKYGLVKFRTKSLLTLE